MQQNESMTMPPAGAGRPLWLRISHWLTALAVILLTLSGWKIYNASPLFGFRFDRDFTIGGWLGGALLWHFAAMWLLFAGFVLYLVMNLVTGRASRQFFPLGPAAVWRDLRAALSGHLLHDDSGRYNAVQKLAYLGVVALLATAIASGLVVWKSVQFPLLRTLLGGYESARVVHFAAMAGLVGFFAVHIVMVALVPKSLWPMIRGR
jgi:thiosulfate reductase cytochrome b subunit